MEEIATPREKRPWFAMTSILIIYETNYFSNPSHKILYDVSFRAVGEESHVTLLARIVVRDPSHAFGMTGNIVTYEIEHFSRKL
jgi:hypothetical protein